MCVPAMKASSSVSRTSRWRRKVKRCFTLRTFISRMMWWVASSSCRICCLTRRLTDAVGQPAGLRLLPALAGWLAATAWQLMRGSAPAPRMQGENPLANPLARVPAGYSPRSPLGPATRRYPPRSFPSLPNPIGHTRPRGIHAPGQSFGVIQTMLLALANVGLERMGRKNSGGYAGIALLSALRAQKQKTKNKKQKTKNKKQKTKNKKQKTKNKKQKTKNKKQKTKNKKQKTKKKKQKKKNKNQKTKTKNKKKKTKNKKQKTKNKKQKTKNKKQKTKNKKQKTKNKKQKTKNKKQKPKTKNQKPKTKRKYPAAGRKKRFRLLRFSRPIRASPQVKKYG